MLKEKRIKGLLYILLFIPLFIISKVNALTFDDFEVTWYYRNKGNESQLLNVIKQEDAPLYASTSEYVNGYTTRVEQTFTKQIQYIVNYQLEMWFSPEQELNYRSDTLQRITEYSFVDSDFKILNTVATENWNRSTSGSGNTVLTINVSMQVLALNNTNAIRFGVYTNNNISIGFYNHSDTIDYYLVNNVSIEENANATIIDQNNQIINGQNNLQNSITNTQDSINSNINDMESAIVDSNKETQDVIKEQFNSCRDSYNLFPGWTVGQYYNSSTGALTTSNAMSSSSDYIRVDFNKNSNYYISNLSTVANTYISAYDINKNYIGRTNSNPVSYINFYPSRITNFGSGSGDINNIAYITISFGSTEIPKNTMLNTGSLALDYEPYGEKICTNKLDEQNKTSKGIWETIKNLPNAFMDMLKGLFIPEDGYFELWFNDLKMFFEDKLGFLATPFTIIIDFVNRYLDLNPSEDIIINIPDITVPNFEDHIIVKATTFNWSQLLKSKDSLNTLWQLYLSFVDVFLILNFINLCENKYNRIFGGDTTQYEYYTVEDSYNVDVNTGEIKSQRRNERTTTRKKVN